ncbi:protein of unknown function (DUF4373) [Popillia japonica]|uniref:Lin1244/Lin1753-like N-terminal domain-containing protein n=1 Tax=Popillia japonica TaxID=7064 RepID=A0AAW1GJA9_POPJA
MKKLKLYLPFEIDFVHNDLHSELIERYGAHGLGIYFMVLMELRNHEGYRCRLSTIKGAARRCVADPDHSCTLLDQVDVQKENYDNLSRYVSGNFKKSSEKCV